MPLVSDYSADEEEDDTLSSGGRASGGGGGSSGAQFTPTRKQPESAFVPWERFTAANADVSKREAGKLQSQAQGAVDRAKDDAFKAQGAFDDAVESNYTHWGDAAEQQPSSTGTADVRPVAETQRRSGEPGYFGNSSGAVGGFGESAAAPRAIPGFSSAPRGLTAGPQPGTRTGLKNSARDGGAVAPKSIESQMGADAWTKLLGDTAKAEAGAKVLGSETGVQAALQKQASGPLAMGGAFDAALVSGAGGKGFRDTARNVGDLTGQLAERNTSSQDAWARLMGDIDEAKATKKANDEWDANRAAAAAAATPAPTTTTTPPTGSGWVPAGFDSYDDFVKKTGGLAGVHDLSQKLDPVSAVMIGLGEAGVYQGNTVSEGFRSGTAKGDLDNQNRVNAFKRIEQEYGADAAKFLWQWMTEGVWKGMENQNSGAIYKTLKDLIEGSIKNGSFVRPTLGSTGNTTGSGVQAAGYTPGETTVVNGETRTTTDEQETARTNAYREGWGEDWDKQFYQERNDKPARR